MFEGVAAGFAEGLIISVAVVEAFIIWALVRGLPEMFMGIIEEYFPAVKRGSKGSRPVEGLANLTQNPVIGTVLSALRSAPTGADATAAPTQNRGLLGGLLRR